MFNATRSFSHGLSLSKLQIKISKRLNSHLASISRSQAPGLIYHLTSDDPFLNLSIEHYIFQHAPAHSKVLLFYINRPCVVIGRNQNPWVEINLELLRSSHASPSSSSSEHSLNNDKSSSSSSRKGANVVEKLKERGLNNVDFVRRRSGGGTVFHDAGNVNWGVICDVGEFTRDKHAQMVVRALSTRAGTSGVRVNERHDIVLDLLPPSAAGEAALRKVSGSAYKLARGRALHHGTALCKSPNLDLISAFLRSRARSVITAKGVESVRSPVANLGLEPELFIDSVEDEFRDMYDIPKQEQPTISLGTGCLDLKEVKDGYEELKSDGWRYLQTPHFDFDSQSKAYGTLKFSAKHGVMNSAQWILPDGQEVQIDAAERHVMIHSVDRWEDEMRQMIAEYGGDQASSERLAALSQELDIMLGSASR